MWKPFIALRKRFYLKPKHTLMLVKHILGVKYNEKQMYDALKEAEEKLMRAELKKHFRDSHYYKGMVDGITKVLEYKK